MYTYEDSSDDEDNNWARLKTIESFERSQESQAWQKAAILRSKLISFFDQPVGKSMAQPRRDSESVFEIMAKQRESERFLQHGEQEKETLSSVGYYKDFNTLENFHPAEAYL